MFDKHSIETYFTYQPLKTEHRKDVHQLINDASLAFAKIVSEYINDESTKQMALSAIMQARMFANQGAVIDELDKLSE